MRTPALVRASSAQELVAAIAGRAPVIEVAGVFTAVAVSLSYQIAAVVGGGVGLSWRPLYMQLRDHRGERDSKSLAPREHLSNLVGRHVQIVGIRVPGLGVSVKIHESKSRR